MSLNKIQSVHFPDIMCLFMLISYNLCQWSTVYKNLSYKIYFIVFTFRRNLLVFQFLLLQFVSRNIYHYVIVTTFRACRKHSAHYK